MLVCARLGILITTAFLYCMHWSTNSKSCERRLLYHMLTSALSILSMEIMLISVESRQPRQRPRPRVDNLSTRLARKGRVSTDNQPVVLLFRATPGRPTSTSPASARRKKKGADFISAPFFVWSTGTDLPARGNTRSQL